MNLILILLIILSSLVVVINVLGGWLLATHKDATPSTTMEKNPPVAVLIAARNEAAVLDRCLKALEQLWYPKELLTVWIGNDQSTDATLEIAAKYCGRNSNWHVLDIKEQWGNIRGKANVLAQLARAAEGQADYFFITDADVAVVPEWIICMLKYFNSEVAIVNGTTVVEGESWFYRLQRYDWAIALGLAKAYAYLPFFGKTLTAIGNNMAIRKEVYNAVGGYEQIPFSITEDFELHRQVEKLGYKTFHSCHAGTKAFTLGASNFKSLLHQRKRWMTGAMELPLPMVLILFFQAIFFPAVMGIFFYLPYAGLLLLLFKMLSQLWLVMQLNRKLKEPAGALFISYEVYTFVAGICLLVFYLLPVKINWKERRY